MKRSILSLAVASIIGLSFATGCEPAATTTTTEETKVKNDGTTVQRQEKVTEKSDGTVVQEETKTVDKK
jgi:hypothetical protein